MTRKKYLFMVTVLCLVLAFIIAGCATPAPAPAPTTSTAPAPKPAPATTTAPAPAPTTKPAPATTTAPAGAQQYGGTLRWIRNTGIAQVGAPQDVPTQTNTILLSSAVMENLLTCDDAERIQPWLAESWKISPDGTSVTLNLKKGVKFQDGTDFNAEAVKSNLEAVLAANCAGSAVLKKVTSYAVVDPYTLRINMTSYDARLLLAFAQSGIGMMASPTALKKPTTPDNAGKDHLIGTGPFKFDSWSKDQFIKMTKWDGYWQKGKPYVDAIEIRNNADITVSLLSFKAKEVNMVESIDPSQYVAMKKEGFYVDIPPLAFVFSITPDSNTPGSPFADARVRKALEYAIDKKGMAQGIGLGTQFPAYQCASPADAWYIPDYPIREFSVTKAKQLLAEAGYPNGFSYPILTDVRIRNDQIVAIQSYLKDVGINTTLDKGDVTRYNTWAQGGWKGILVPGFPNWSSFNSWVTRFTDANLTFPSQVKPDRWKEDWDSIVSQTDEGIRIDQMKIQLKKLYDEALVIPYIFDGPRYVTDGTIMDMQWDSHHINGFYSAPDVWLKKK